MSEISSLALLLFVGAAAAFTDWRERRVPNRLVLLGLGAALAAASLQLAGSVLGHLGRRWLGVGEFYMPWRWYPDVAAHAGLSLAAGWTLWRLDVWPAGDAKLYLALSTLLPFVDPNLAGFPHLLFMVFLINVFVPAGLLFAAEGFARLAAAAPAALAAGPWVALKAAGDRARVRAREVFDRRWQAAALVVNLASLFLALRLAERRLNAQGLGPLGRVAVFLLMYAAWDRLSPILRRPRVGLAALAFFSAAACAAAASGADLLDLLARTARSVLGFGFFLSLARTACHGSLLRAGRVRAAPAELRRGVILGDETWASLSADPEAAAVLGPRRCDGLTEAEAAALRGRLAARGELTVRRAVPFAVWILLGAALTLWRPGTVVSWLLPFAEKGWRLLSAGRGA